MSLCVLLLNSCKKDTIDPPVDKEIEQLVNSHVIFGRTPGIAVGTFHAGEDKQYMFGSKDLTKGEDVDEFTMFEICSITKTFTALLFADFVEKDKLSLTDTIAGFFPSNIKVPDNYVTPITFLQLLNHTSGLPREPNLPNLQAYAEFDDLQLASYFDTLQLNNIPGSTYEYSNLGMGLAGYLLGKITGQSYSNLLKERIFVPFNMAYTTCSEADFITDNYAEGFYGNTEVGFYQWSDIFAASGVIKSNLHDMMIYLKENIDYTNSVLKEALLLTKGRTLTLDEHFHMGLAWHITIDDDGDEIFWHNGGTMGFSTFIGYNNSTKDGVVVLMNSYCMGEQDVMGMKILEILKGQ